MFFILTFGGILMRKAKVNRSHCVACGCCTKVCPKKAIKVYKGLFAKVNVSNCVGCGICVKNCPASIIILEDLDNEKKQEMV